MDFIPILPGGVAEIRVSLDGQFVTLPLRNQIDGLVKLATQTGAQHAMQRWQQHAAEGIDGIQINSRRYLRGITWGPEFGSPNGYQVRLINDWSKAPIIEAGYESFSMLPGMLNSPQARRNQKGEAYLIVPFRHGTPRSSESEAGKGDQRATIRSMPPDVHATAQRLEQSRVTGAYLSHHDDPNVRNRPAHPETSNRRAQLWGAHTGENPAGAALRRTYQWGGRIGLKSLPAHLQALAKPWHTAPLFQGMVRMDKGEGTKRRYSHYLTFRIAHQNMIGSDKWQHPGAPPKPISAKVAAKYAEEVAALMQSVFDEGLS